MKTLALMNISEKHLVNVKGLGCEVIIAEDPTDEQLKEADVLLGWCNGDLSSERIEKAHNLKWINITSAGFENLPFETVKKKGLLVSNSRGIHGIPIAEHVIAMMLSTTRNLGLLRDQQKAHKWEKVPSFELYGKTMGILGLGSIGEEIAKLAKAFGMKVIGTKNTVVDLKNVDKVYPSNEMETVLKESDYIVIALPHYTFNDKIIGEKEFKTMKDTAYLINIARGGIVDEAAMIKALQNKEIAGALLDVVEKEPLPAESPLWDMENVLITPHQAALSPRYMERAMEIFAGNIEKYRKGEMLHNQIDLSKGY